MSKEKAVEFVLAHWRNGPDEALERKMKEAQSDDERFALYVEAAAGWDLTAAISGPRWRSWTPSERRRRRSLCRICRRWRTTMSTM